MKQFESHPDIARARDRYRAARETAHLENSLQREKKASPWLKINFEIGRPEIVLRIKLPRIAFF